jgi:hypothetical protein
MKTLIKDLKSIRKDLTGLLAIAITTLIIIEFILSNIPEFFNGGYKLGVIFSNLSLSYIAGFIFYFLTVHLKTEKDKRKYNEVIGRLSYQIIVSTDNMINSIINHGSGERHTYNEKLIYEACSKIEVFKSDAPLHWADNTQGNWIEFLHNYSSEIDKTIKKLNDRIIFIEPKHSTLLARIEDAMLLKQINGIFNYPNIIPNKDLTIFATSIKLYMNLIEDLRIYNDKYLKDYKDLKGESIGYRRDM